MSDRKTLDVQNVEIDCWETIFDYMSLVDLNSFAKTCKRMQKIVGWYFKLHFSNKEALFLDKKLIINRTDVNGFHAYISKLMLIFRFIDMSNLESLKKISLCNMNISAVEREADKDILNRIECVHLWNCNFSSGEPYEDLLKFCPNLRQLKITDAQRYGRKWLLQKYPKLEHFIIDKDKSIDKIKTFLEQNPHLKKLTITTDIFRQQLLVFMESDCKLNTLEIVSVYDFNSDILRTQLNALHERGFYQRLILELRLSNKDLAVFSSFRGLDEIDLKHMDQEKVVLSQPIQLKMITFNINNVDNFELFIQNLVHVNKLNFINFNEEPKDTHRILLFILRHLPSLKEISFEYSNRLLFVDLMALNEERKKLPGARAVTIAVDEPTYLATMRKFGWQSESLVTIKRN